MASAYTSKLVQACSLAKSSISESKDYAKIKCEFSYGYLPRPPESPEDYSGLEISLFNLNDLWNQALGYDSEDRDIRYGHFFHGDFVVIWRILEDRGSHRKGEIRLELFRQNHTCGDDVHGLDLTAIFVVYVTGLPAVCHTAARVQQSSSHVAAHMRQLKKGSHTPAMVQNLHILLRLISFDKQQGVATFVFWPRYIGFRSSVFLICEAGLLNVAAETLLVATLSLQFDQRIICSKEEDSKREVCICNEFSLLKRFCVPVLHPPCSSTRVSLMHRTVFQQLVGQFSLMAIVSISSPQFLILHCCNMLLEKLLNFKKMSSVICLDQGHIHSALRQWNMVLFDVTYGLLLRQNLLHLHVGCFLPYLFLMWNQAFFCLCVCDCEVLHYSVDGCGFLLRYRWWVSKNKLILVDGQVLSKRLGRDYVSSRQIMVAHSGSFTSILDLLYCSLPRPPEAPCDSL